MVVEVELWQRARQSEHDFLRVMSPRVSRGAGSKGNVEVAVDGSSVSQMNGI